VKLLIDNALSPQVAGLLSNAGHDAVPVRQYAPQSAEDIRILERAGLEDRIVVSADSDFAMLLATLRLSNPSFILFREPEIVRADEYASRVLAGLPPVLERDLRIRALPFATDAY